MLIAALAPLARAGEVESSPEQRFTQASKAFQTALNTPDKERARPLFREAAAIWRSLTAEIHNAALERNIGNAELLAGEPAWAILAFRRALAIDPSDDAAAGGLAAARRAAGTDSLAPGGSSLSLSAPVVQISVSDAKSSASPIAWPRIKSRALAWIDRPLPRRPMLLAGAVLYLSGFVFAFLKRPRTAVALITCGVAIAALLVTDERRTDCSAVLISTGITARQGPADLYEPAFKEPLRPGLEVLLEEERAGGWVKFRLADGREAWTREEAFVRVGDK
jgi:tetratricopeptide (TPR) repeat protein